VYNYLLVVRQSQESGTAPPLPEVIVKGGDPYQFQVERTVASVVRQLAIAAALLMTGLAIGAWTGGGWIIIIFGLAAVVTVADNGLAYVSVAEMAGPGWTGRALGIQNTGQNAIAILIVPVIAAVIEGASYGVAFLLVALSALVAVPITPVCAEKRARASIATAADASQLSTS